MEFLNACPICQSKRLKVLKSHTFVLKEELKTQELNEMVTDLEERLWIYFHKILKDLSPVQVECTSCLNCDFIFTNPRFTEEDIQTKYQTIESLGFDQIRHEKKGLPKSAIRGQRIFQLIEGLNQQTEHKGPMRILDYGGAEGYLLEPFLELGHQGYLIDFVKYDRTHPEIQYLGRDLNDLDAKEKFDVILLLHTLEHVVNPVELLVQLSKHLNEGGLLYIEVPLGAWLEWEFLREPVTHVNFFSETSLLHCIEQAELVGVHINTQWQWVTTTKTPCINLVVTNIPSSYKRLSPKPLQYQMKGFSYLFGGLKENPKYYSKLVMRHLLNKIYI